MSMRGCSSPSSPAFAFTATACCSMTSPISPKTAATAPTARCPAARSVCRRLGRGRVARARGAPALLAIGRPALIVGVALLGAVILYNLWSKKIAVLGAVNMGLCRGLSLLLGAASAVRCARRKLARDSARLAALLVLAIAARRSHALHRSGHESRPDRDAPRSARLSARAPLLRAHRGHRAVFPRRPRPGASPRLGQPLALSRLRLHALRGLQNPPELTRSPTSPIPPTIGQLIRLLLPLQAAFCIASRSLAGGIAAAIADHALADQPQRLEALLRELRSGSTRALSQYFPTRSDCWPFPVFVLLYSSPLRKRPA